jgi:hypothetical protein
MAKGMSWKLQDGTTLSEQAALDLLTEAGYDGQEASHIVYRSIGYPAVELVNAAKAQGLTLVLPSSWVRFTKRALDSYPHSRPKSRRNRFSKARLAKLIRQVRHDRKTLDTMFVRGTRRAR